MRNVCDNVDKVTLRRRYSYMHYEPDNISRWTTDVLLSVNGAMEPFLEGPASHCPIFFLVTRHMNVTRGFIVVKC